VSLGVARSAARSERDRLVGSALGLGAAISYGVVVVAERSLAKEHLPVATVVGGRYALACLVLLILLAVSGRPLRPAPGERVRAALLGLVGYVVNSSLFYLALGHGSAAAVAMLFYLYPAIIAVLEIAARLRPVSARSLLAPVLSGFGVAVVVANGGRVAITPAGAVLALSASLAVSIYLLASSRLIRRSHPMVTAAWVAGGVAVSMATVGTALSGYSLPADAIGRLVLASLATAAATTCVYAALLRLGAGPTAVFMALQALVALLLAGVILGEPVTVAQVFGGFALIVGAALASSARRWIEPAAAVTPSRARAQ
jgi:drug/metabolite transporter (DMT)-like permease